MDVLNKLLSDEAITEYGVVRFDRLRVINPRLIKDAGNIKSALLMLIPYRCGEERVSDGNNVGLFARCRDYHKYAEGLFSRLIPKLKAVTGGEIRGFCDRSPIDEKGAAVTAGLGFKGRNGLLINKKYGSFVFIAELLFTAELEEKISEAAGSCGECRLCEAACPVGALRGGSFLLEKCLSSISQKKIKTDEERKALCATRTVWGCDICQNACPYNRSAQFGSIGYFREGFISRFTKETLQALDDEKYRDYAFSFRPRAVLEENFLTVSDKCDII